MIDTDTASPAPPEPEKFYYRAFLVNGTWLDFASLYDLPQLWVVLRGDGFLITDSAALMLDKLLILSRLPIPPQQVGYTGNVVPLHRP